MITEKESYLSRKESAGTKDSQPADIETERLTKIGRKIEINERIKQNERQRLRIKSIFKYKVYGNDKVILKVV